MNTTKDLNYRLYVQKETGFTRTAFQSEFAKYMVIRSGDVETVKKNLAEIRKDFMKGKGELSDNPVRNVMYHFVVSVAMISRICVEGGMNHDVAYTLSDIYIKRGDKCTSVEALIDLLEEMQLDFAGRMRALKKEEVLSIHIRKSIDYIFEHLHESLTVKDVAKVVGLSADYFAKLFYKEMKITVKDYIGEAKINTAANMLVNTDFSYLDIAMALGYSSQSAFISVFRKYKNLTPKEYREQNYLQNMSAKQNEKLYDKEIPLKTAKNAKKIIDNKKS